MCKFIGVEVLVANALITAMENAQGSSITFSKLNEYGISVIDFLESNYSERAIILYNDNENGSGSRILNCTRYFEVKGDTISVKKGVTAAILRNKFRTPLAYEILKAVLSANRLIVA